MIILLGSSRQAVCPASQEFTRRWITCACTTVTIKFVTVVNNYLHALYQKK